MPPAELGTEIIDVPVGDLKHYPGNAKKHALDVIVESLKSNSQYRPLVVRNAPGDERPNGHMCVLAGNGTLKAARDRMKWKTIKVSFIVCDDDTAKRINLVDNRAPELGGYDVEALAELLDQQGGDYVGTGYDEESAAALMRAAGLSRAAGAAEQERQGLKDAKPNPRKLPIDAIFTLNWNHTAAMLAADCGLKVGVQSDARGVLKQRDRWEWKFSLAFVDNEWKSYDHDKHASFVELVKPKYATTRDVMTPEQCEEAGIAYYPLEQIIEWADEIAEHADHAIIIPKYDCLDDIPERHMLGYSVPTSYGGTPLPASAFAGRPVHLLGGSWKNQLRYLAALGDDVVSLDFNHCYNLSQWGQFVVPDGRVMMIRDLQPDCPDPSNTSMCALALSLGNIGRAIFDLTGGQSGATPDVMPDAPAPPLDPDDLAADPATQGAA